MMEGVTCYERDEALCEDQMCLRVGCRIRNERLARSSSDMAGLREVIRNLRARRIMCDGGNGNVYDIADEECELAADFIEQHLNTRTHAAPQMTDTRSSGGTAEVKLADEMSSLGYVEFSDCLSLNAYNLILRALRSSPTPQAHQRNWTEDASHENGNYECMCCECDQMFIGHKRRVVCKACSNLLSPQAQAGGTKSAPATSASHNSGERSASGDTAGAGAGTVETTCCKGLAPPDECQCEIERKAAGHPPYYRGAAQGWRTLDSAPASGVDDDEQTPVLFWVEGGGWKGAGCVVPGYVLRRRDGSLIGKPNGHSGFTVNLWQPMPAGPSVSTHAPFSQCEQCFQPATCKKYGCSVSAVSSNVCGCGVTCQDLGKDAGCRYALPSTENKSRG